MDVTPIRDVFPSASSSVSHRTSAAVRASEEQLAGEGRVVVRYSGTEPLARIMIEAARQEDVDRHCEEIEKVFVREIGL